MESVPRSAVHRDLDPHFFTDYALFSGAFRYYAAKCLEGEYSRHPNDGHRRLYVVGLYREEFAAYEDMGAVLEALLRYRAGDIPHPVEGILRYKDDKVFLKTLFSRRGVGSADDLAGALKPLGADGAAAWAAAYPRIDYQRVFRRMCRFIWTDCASNQSQYGVDAYNRIKHGLAFVPNGRRYLADAPDAPGVVLVNRTPQAQNPYIVLAVPMQDKDLKERARRVEFIQSTTRALVGFYLIDRYPDFLRDTRGIAPAPRLFELPPLVAVREFLEQLSDKPESQTS